ncbi:hypothetical protein EVAR_64030_1 [Eumeta japonica]|uniref:Uncharacterized protein n=1 Tax=Eumeta variegata TaxID=151549 RepID=A0A4C1Z2D9_EUMVA|nr:hypothetical protein EVAR_64030_1 [Eumeta japonica]
MIYEFSSSNKVENFPEIPAFKVLAACYLDIGNYTTIKQTRESDLVSCHNKTEASRVTVTDSPKSETKLPRSYWSISARGRHATRRVFPFLSCRDLLHIRIRFSSASIYADADADADVDIDADVPHVRMRMRIFATSLI